MLKITEKERKKKRQTALRTHTQSKGKVNKTFIKHPGRLTKVLRTFNLVRVSALGNKKTKQNQLKKYMINFHEII